MKIHFYKNTKTTVIDKFIYHWQKILKFKYPQYTHVEIEIDGVFYTSSFRDKGVRKARIKYKPENWDYIEIDISEEDKIKIKEFFDKHMTDKYDISNIIFNKILGLGTDDPSNWICSEICARAILETSLNIVYPREPKDIYPAGFYTYLDNFIKEKAC